MKELLYYPGFEIKNETWLKFALLYLDHISPIIPYINASEKDYLTPTFLKVKNNSDLISIKRPTPDDIDVAFETVLAKLENQLEKKYYHKHSGTCSNDHLQYWRDQENYRCLLYKGKYDTGFENYCVENHFGKKVPKGLLLSRDVLNLYMSYLAKAVSEREHLDLISDSVQYEEGLIDSFSKNSNETVDYLRVARQEIQLAVPLCLKQIPIERILEVRQSNNFAWERKAYIEAIDNVIEKRAHGVLDYSIEKELQEGPLIARLVGKVLNFNTKMVLIPFKIKTIQEVSEIKGTVSSVLEMSDNMTGLRTGINSVRQKHNAKLYLVSLRALSKYYTPAP